MSWNHHLRNEAAIFTLTIRIVLYHEGHSWSEFLAPRPDL
jgi:hypothetical protein